MAGEEQTESAWSAPADGSVEAGAAADRVRLGEDQGRLALLVDGVVQSVAVGQDEKLPGYWCAVLPDVRPRRVLLLGLGGGTIAHLLTHRFGPVPIVGVEHDPVVVALGQERFGLGLPNLAVVVQDAFAYVEGCKEEFDFICVDLYDGLKLPRGTMAKPFLKKLRSMLSSDGEVAFNLTLTRRLPNHLHRLAQVFRVAGSTDVDLNVVVRCRAC